MFLLINNEDLHKVNKRIIFNITNDGDVNLLMAKVKNGDVVELELTELATNTLHYVLASHKTFIKDVPYSFEFSPYLGVNTLSGTKNIVDFKLNKVIVKIQHDRYAPSIDHYLIVGEDNDQNGLFHIDGVPNLELKPLRDERIRKLDYVSDKRVLHRHDECNGDHHDSPAQYHNAPHTAYPNYDLLPQYRHCLAEHRPLNKPRPTKVIKLSQEAHAQIVQMLSEFRYVLPAGGCVLPIINPDLLVNKDYLQEYVKQELSKLVTIDILSTRIESGLKDLLTNSNILSKTLSDVVYNNVLERLNESPQDTIQNNVDAYNKEEANAIFIRRDSLEELDVYTKSEVDIMLQLLQSQIEELKENKASIPTKETDEDITNPNDHIELPDDDIEIPLTDFIDSEPVEENITNTESSASSVNTHEAEETEVKDNGEY